MRIAPDVNQDRRKPDVLKTVSILANGLMLAVTIVTFTIAVLKTESFNVNSKRIDGLIVVTDNMKDVDAAMLKQVTELKGNTTAEIMLINERIANISKLLEEIKALVTRRS